MKKHILITYSLTGVKKPIQITRTIYGYTDSSHKGKYTYKRKGILSGTPYQKISRTTILLTKKNAEKIIPEMKKLPIHITLFEIENIKQLT